MATWLCSGYYSGGSGSPYIEIYYQVNSTNTSAMTSNVTVWLYGRRNGNSWSWASDCPGASLYVNGNGYSGSGNFDYTSGDTTLISATLNIQHNSSGAATLSVSGYHNSGVSIGSASCSGSVSLPNIASFVSLNKTASYWNNDESAAYFKGSGTSTLGKSRVWLELNPNSSDKLYQDDVTDTQLSNGYSLAMTSTFKSLIWSKTVNATSIPVRMGICKNGDSNSAGASYKDFVLNLTQSPPTLGTVSFSDTNSTTTTLTGSSSKMIKGASTLTLSIAPATANKSGSIVSYTITPSGGSPEVVAASSSTITRTYQKATFSSIAISVTDSRGWITNTTKTLTESASGYFSPTVGSFLAVRNATTTTTVNLSGSGTWFNSSFGSQSNTLSVKWYYKTHSATTWSSGGTVTPTKSGNTWSFSASKTSCPTNVAYDFKIEVIDKLNTVNKEVTASVAQPAFKLYKDGSSIDHAVLPLTTSMVEDSLGTKISLETWLNGEIVDEINNRVSNIPIGTIAPFAGSTVPSEWLECNGAAVSRTTYNLLYAAIGTTYGSGDGSATFNLPNLQGKVIVGVSTSDGDFDLGDSGGEKKHTLSVSEMPSHSHPQYVTANSGGTAIRRDWSSDGDGGLYSQGVNTANTGGGGSHNNLQPYLTTKYIIKAVNNPGTAAVGNTIEQRIAAIETQLGCDYVVDEGTSGNWRYRKWNSGLAELWETTASVSSPAGSSGYVYPSFPFTMNNTSYEVQYSKTSTTGTSYVNYQECLHPETYGYTTSGFTLKLYNSSSAAVSIKLDIYVRGAWKALSFGSTSSVASAYEVSTNKVTSISSSSTNTQYPSAKAVYDMVGDVESVLRTLNG